MKNTIAALMLGLALFSATSAFTPKRAEALLIVNIMRDPDEPLGCNWGRSCAKSSVIPVVVGCLLLIPLCLLDEKIDGAATFSSRDLLDNGYTQIQVDRISMDQRAIAQLLIERNQHLEFELEDTRSSIEQGLTQLYPQVSSDYVNFLSERAR